jgi:hypothetical protein
MPARLAGGYRRVSDSEGGIMPRLSKDSAPAVQDAGPAGTEFIQFSPREQLAETLAAMQANAQRAMRAES